MGLYKANGTRATLANVAKTTDPDPLVKVTEDLYRWHRTGPEDDQPQGTLKSLYRRAGTTLRQSELAGWFPPSVVDQINPKTGPATGTQANVQIIGRNLDGVTGITFGGTAATAVSVKNDRLVTCTRPAHAAGTVDVVLTCDSGTVTKVGGYTYTP